MRCALVMTVFLFLNLRSLWAQVPITSGQTVRVTSARYELNAEIGRVLAAARDTIVVESKGLRTVHYRQVVVTDTLVLAVTAIDRLEVRVRTSHRTGRGAILGLGIGAATGFIIGLITYEPCPPDALCIMQPTSSLSNAVTGAAAFGFIGAGVGALVGSTIRVDHWEEKPLHPGLTLRPLPQHRLGLGVAASF